MFENSHKSHDKIPIALFRKMSGKFTGTFSHCFQPEGLVSTVVRLLTHSWFSSNVMLFKSWVSPALILVVSDITHSIGKLTDFLSFRCDLKTCVFFYIQVLKDPQCLFRSYLVQSKAQFHESSVLVCSNCESYIRGLPNTFKTNTTILNTGSRFDQSFIMFLFFRNIWPQIHRLTRQICKSQP